MGSIVDLGVRKGDKIMIRGYVEGYNPDLGVREYQKVENPLALEHKKVNLMKREKLFLRNMFGKKIVQFSLKKLYNFLFKKSPSKYEP